MIISHELSTQSEIQDAHYNRKAVISFEYRKEEEHAQYRVDVRHTGWKENMKAAEQLT